MSAPMENYFEQGLKLLDEGNYAAAIESLTKALRLSLGDLAEILLLRGICYAALEDYQRALADFNEALHQNPYLAEAYFERGNVLRVLAHFPEAAQDYSNALVIAPDYGAALFYRAVVYDEMNELQAAEADLDRVLLLQPEMVAAYELRGRLRATRNEYDGAIADLQQYLRMGGGREYDNQSEIQSFLIVLRTTRFFMRLLGLYRPDKQQSLQKKIPD